MRRWAYDEDQIAAAIKVRQAVLNRYHGRRDLMLNELWLQTEYTRDIQELQYTLKCRQREIEAQRERERIIADAA